jgi:hypothetical protein
VIQEICPLKLGTTAAPPGPPFRNSWYLVPSWPDAGANLISGAAWARCGDKKVAIVSLDLITTDPVNRNGVPFLVPVETDYNRPRSKRPSRATPGRFSCSHIPLFRKTGHKASW